MKGVSNLFTGQDAETAAKFSRLTCLFLLSVPIFVLGVYSEKVNPFLGFDRGEVLSGQAWRILSCNFVHLSSNHMFMNLSVYVLAVLIFGPSLSILSWHCALLVCSVAVGLGILLFDADVYGYVGLSGALYGMVIFGLLVNIKGNLLTYGSVYLFVTYKVITQQLGSYNPESMMEFIGGSVIASAHLIGLLAGNACALFYFFWVPRRLRGEVQHELW